MPPSIAQASSVNSSSAKYAAHAPSSSSVCMRKKVSGPVLILPSLAPKQLSLPKDAPSTSISVSLQIMLLRNWDLCVFTLVVQFSPKLVFSVGNQGGAAVHSQPGIRKAPRYHHEAESSGPFLLTPTSPPESNLATSPAGKRIGEKSLQLLGTDVACGASKLCRGVQLVSSTVADQTQIHVTVGPGVATGMRAEEIDRSERHDLVER